jgi:hypothetical protein
VAPDLPQGQVHPLAQPVVQGQIDGRSGGGGQAVLGENAIDLLAFQGVAGGQQGNHFLQGPGNHVCGLSIFTNIKGGGFAPAADAFVLDAQK